LPRVQAAAEGASHLQIRFGRPRQLLRQAHDPRNPTVSKIYPVAERAPHSWNRKVPTAIRGGAALARAPAKDASAGFAKGSIVASGFTNRMSEAT
jgi:hypothetical protein